MLGVLLESKARRQRRAAGATLSVVLHVAIIAAVAAGTVHGRPAPPEKPQAVFVQIAPPVHRVTPERARSAPSTAPVLPSAIVIRHVDAPTIVPTELPPVDLTSGLASDSIAIGGGKDSGVPSSFGSKYGTETVSDNRDWDVRELLMHVLAPAKPRYPEALRSAGVDGRVLVQFAVDTTGRVDMASVRVLESTHDLFSRAVRDALTSFRFRPAEVAGHRVQALAQMPFEFHITR